MVKFKHIKTVKSAEKVITGILIHAKPIIGVKCQGANLGPKGQITYVSLATWDSDVYVFDVKRCPEIMFSGGLSRLLQSTEMLKVFHDCSQDSATLHHQFGVKIVNLFDTQIAHSVAMDNQGMSPRRLTLQQLCQEFKIATYRPTTETQRLIADDPNVWARRPCPTDLLTIASSEVLPLVPALYQLTSRNIPEKSMNWFTHLTEENRLAMILGHSGRKSRMPCPKDRKQTSSLHLVPLADPLHFCQ